MHKTFPLECPKCKGNEYILSIKDTFLPTDLDRLLSRDAHKKKEFEFGESQKKVSPHLLLFVCSKCDTFFEMNCSSIQSYGYTLHD